MAVCTSPGAPTHSKTTSKSRAGGSVPGRETRGAEQGCTLPARLDGIADDHLAGTQAVRPHGDGEPDIATADDQYVVASLDGAHCDGVQSNGERLHQCAQLADVCIEGNGLRGADADVLGEGAR